MIDIKDLHKKFGPVHALKGINLQVRKGEIYGFIGKNGAGKSTTMNIMAGLSKPLSGSCVVNGISVSKIRHPGELSIGYLPEAPSFYSWMTAKESLLYLDNPQKRQGRAAAGVQEMLSWVGLDDVADRKIGGFSRGMKQRLGLCQILMHNPQLLILDEPSSALDPEGRSDILRLIQELNQMGKTIIFSTHILSDVEKICHTVGMIAQGQMIMEKPLTDMLRHNVTPIFQLELAKPIQEEITRKLLSSEAVIDIKQHTSDQLEITVSEETEGSKAIITWAAAQQLAVHTMAIKKQNLEDLFIKEVNGK